MKWPVKNRNHNEAWYKEVALVLDEIKQASVPDNVKLAARWILTYHLFEEPTRWDELRNLIARKWVKNVRIYTDTVDPREFIDRLSLFNLVRGSPSNALPTKEEIEALQGKIDKTFIDALQLLKCINNDLI